MTLDAAVAAYIPFVLAIAFILLSPLLSARAKKAIRGQIREDAAGFGRNPDEYPAEVSIDTIGDYVDYAADSVQVLPLALLPVAGTAFAISREVVPEVALGLLAAIVLVSVVLDLWLLTRSPQDYNSRKILRLSIASFAGLVANLASIAVLALAS